MKHKSQIQATAGIDFNKTYADNMGLQCLTSNPTPAILGQVYFNTSTNKLMIYTSGGWIALGVYITSVAGTSPINVSINNNIATISIDQTGINHTNLLNKGANTHAQIDTHIADSTVHYTQSQIDHLNLANRGSNTHAQIDTHIADSSKHFLINDAGFNSNETWSASKIKSYVDALKAGMDWQDSVISTTNTPPSNPSDGNRYRIGTSPTGIWAGYANYLTEYDANTGTWIYFLSDGMAVFDENADIASIWTGSAWTSFGTATHNNLGGIQGGSANYKYHIDEIQYANLTTLTNHSDASNLHTHSATYSALGHTHDDRYYTESEITTILTSKSDTGHIHDDRYYTESEIATLLTGKSDTSHTHTGVYAKVFSALNTSTGGTETFTHNLNCNFCIVHILEFQNGTTWQTVVIDNECETVNTVKVYFPSGINAGQFKVLILGVA